MIQTLIDWLVNAISVLGYPGVIVAVFLESFFAPIPSEIILPFAGFVASTGALDIYLVIVFATVAAYFGSLPFYILGVWGEKWVNNFLDRYGKYFFIEKEDVEWAFSQFNKHGQKLVFIGRLIPVIRTLISFPAGVTKMKFIKFSIYTLLGSLLWNILLTYTGYLLGDNWEVIGEYVTRYEKVIIVIGVVFVFAYIVRGIVRRFRNSRS